MLEIVAYPVATAVLQQATTAIASRVSPAVAAALTKLGATETTPVAQATQLAGQMLSESLEKQIASDGNWLNSFNIFLREPSLQWVISRLVEIKAEPDADNLAKASQIATFFRDAMEKHCPNTASGFSDGLFQVISNVIEETLARALPGDARLSALIDRVQPNHDAESIANAIEAYASETAQSITQLRTFEQSYLQLLAEHYSQISPSGSGPKHDVERIYVDPTIISDDGQSDHAVAAHHRRLLHLKGRLASRQFRRQFGSHKSLEQFMATIPSRSVILGDPGAGKSTLTGVIAYRMATSAASGSLEFPVHIPVVVTLRDYAKLRDKNDQTILEHLDHIFRKQFHSPPPDGYINLALVTGRLLVIFDGLDELTNLAQRSALVSEIELLSLKYLATPLLVTSRAVGYDKAPLRTEFVTHEIAHFDENQIRQYCERWFKIAEEENATVLTESFLAETRHLRDLVSNPLLLALMCNIYHNERYIPSNRPAVYDKCATFMFDTWDAKRTISAPFRFASELRPLIRRIANWIYEDRELQSGVSSDKLVQFITSALLELKYEDYDSAHQEALAITEYCTDRAWVFNEAGSDPITLEPLFLFSHRTFLEFFTAEYRVSVAGSLKQLGIDLRGYIAAGERDVICELAYQQAAERFEGGADTLITQLLSRFSALRGFDSRANLLSFCIRSLSYLKPKPPTVRNIARSVVAWFEGAVYDDSKSPHKSRIIPVMLAMQTGPRDEYAVIFADELKRGLQSAIDSDALSIEVAHIALHSRMIFPHAAPAATTLSELVADNPKWYLDRAQAQPGVSWDLAVLGLSSVSDWLREFGIQKFFENDVEEAPWVSTPSDSLSRVHPHIARGIGSYIMESGSGVLSESVRSLELMMHRRPSSRVLPQSVESPEELLGYFLTMALESEFRALPDNKSDSRFDVVRDFLEKVQRHVGDDPWDHFGAGRPVVRSWSDGEWSLLARDVVRKQGVRLTRSSE